MEFLTLNQGGHTSNAIPKDRWPTVGLFGGTIEPLGCDVLFKDRMCLNFLFVWRCVFEGRWKAVVFMDEFLWWGCLFSECFTRFFGWLRRNIVIFNVKRIVPGWNSDLGQTLMMPASWREIWKNPITSHVWLHFQEVNPSKDSWDTHRKKLGIKKKSLLCFLIPILFWSPTQRSQR